MRILIGASALLLCAAAPPSPTQSPESVMAAIAAVPRREARFREEKRIGLLTAPVVSTGRLLWRRPDHLEKLTESPISERLVVDGTRLVITEGTQTPRVVDLAQIPEAAALVGTLQQALAGDLAALRHRFTITELAAPSGWRLDLVPTDGPTARVLSRVILEGSGGEPRTMSLVQADGDAQRLEITPAP